MIRTYTSAAELHDAPPEPRARFTVSRVRLQRGVLWLLLAASGLVFIEPSPYELTMVVALLVFAASGFVLRAPLIPLIVLLSLLNIGYSVSAVNLLNQQALVNWVLTSWFLAGTCVFFACVMQEDTKGRLDAMMSGYVVAALIASTAAIVGYARIFGGFDDLFLLYDRARGTFKDPNVLGPFLVLPALIALQRVMLGNLSQTLRNGLLFAVFSAAIFLSFSRGAWGLLVFTSGFMLFLMFVTSPSPGTRARIVLTTVAVASAGVVFLIALLSIDAVADLFRQRASLSQSYDVGAQGRFARHLLGAILAFDVPLGIGPLQFSKYFPEDTHNSYLNAFMSGGWLSGVCYPALVLLTATHGLRHAFQRTTWQLPYLAVYAAFVGTALESLIIDTDHWRHYFLLIGLVWGCIVAGRYPRDSLA